MRYLLDTCVLSEIPKKNSNQTALSWLKQRNSADCYVSVLTFGEIQKGISRLPKSKRQATLQVWLDDELPRFFETRVLNITEEVVLTWGKLQATMEHKGITLPSIDGLIAATALTHGLTLVTCDTKILSKTGVELFDPWVLTK